jgi:hypothetical protein
MPAAFTTFAHVAVSIRINSLDLSGSPPTGS